MNSSILPKLNALPIDWHGAGTATPFLLEGIERHCLALTTREQSLETGAGKSTLLFSHLFKSHWVFAIDEGRSVTRVLESELLADSSVKLIDGPTQRTLPATTLPPRLDCVLLDGPHGYPFPDLEYYYVYPHIRAGGLLILDDVHIPTIRRMLDILRADEMFEHLETLSTTAFLRRTDAPATNPYGDEWWKQGYNQGLVRRNAWRDWLKRSPVGPLLRSIYRKLR
jgi:hypothetical protein